MSEGPVITPARKVLQPQEMRAVTEAATYLSQARQIRTSAAEQVAKAAQDARDKGFAEGFAAGRKEGLDALVAAVAQVRERLHASEEELAGIVYAAVETIIGEFDDADLLKRCVRRALHEASADMWAVVRVSAEDRAQVAEAVASAPLTASWPEIRKIEADPLLKRGEMVLETPKGRMHVGLRQQMSRLKAGLESGGA